MPGSHPYGYTSYHIDIAPYLKAGDNTIAIKADNSKQKNSRWYSGSGIYRHIWLEPPGHTHKTMEHAHCDSRHADSAIARIRLTLLRVSTHAKTSECL